MTRDDVHRCPTCGKAWIALDLDTCTRCRAEQTHAATNVKASTAATRVQFTTDSPDSHTYIDMAYGEVVRRIVIARRRGDQAVWLDGQRLELSKVRAVHRPADRKQRAA